MYYREKSGSNRPDPGTGPALRAPARALQKWAWLEVSGFLFAEAAEEVGELVFLVGGEGLHSGDDTLDEGQEGVGDAVAAGVGEVDADDAAVLLVALAADEPLALQVVDDGGEVVRALEVLLGELADHEGTKVVEGFQRAELAGGEAGGGDGAAGPGGDGVGGAHELDEDVQGAALLVGTLVMGGHPVRFSCSVCRRCGREAGPACPGH
jgi:hypothetical protein